MIKVNYQVLKKEGAFYFKNKKLLHQYSKVYFLLNLTTLNFSNQWMPIYLLNKFSFFKQVFIPDFYNQSSILPLLIIIGFLIYLKFLTYLN